MRSVFWALKIALFGGVLLFAVRNTDAVTVRFYLGAEWRAPLVFVLLAFFCAGVATGLLACLPRLLRQRREIGALRREREGAERRDAQIAEQAGRAAWS
jgi:uncharacterized integral membrane protein